MKKILDAGCGVGRFVYNISKQQPEGEFFGIDIDPENITQAKKNFSNINFQEMSVETLKFETAFFDKVYSRDVLEHVDNVELAVSEMSRVLKNGGKLVVKLPAEKSEKWLLKIRPTYFEEIHHKRIFKDGYLEKILTESGFQLQKKEAQGFLDHFLLYFLFKTTKVSHTQLALGSWNSHPLGYIIAPIHAFLKPERVFHTWLKFIPIWLVTLPAGYVLNSIGNRYFPKSVYYEFVKVG